MPSHETPSAGGDNFIFRHAGQDVGDVVLDAKVAQASGLRVGGASPLRRLGTGGRDAAGTRRRGRLRYDFAGKLRREIIRVQIGGDDLRFRVVKLFKIGDDAAEGVVRRLGFQIADVLADENLVADGKRDGVLQMRADGQNRFVAADVRRL